MYSPAFLPRFPAFALVLLAFCAFSSVHAALYVHQPSDTATCYGGQPCTVQWLDDGSQPLLTSIGMSYVGLYTGDQHLVQEIQPVDVSAALSLTFTPDPKAGPNTGGYYIGFTSVSAKQPNSSSSYLAFSPFFKLAQMTGSSSSAVASDTSTIPIPKSSSQSQSAVGGTVVSTTFVGKPPSSTAASDMFPSFTPSTSSEAPESTSSHISSTSSGIVKTTSPTSSPSATSAASPSQSSSSSSAAARTFFIPLSGLVGVIPVVYLLL